MNKPHVPVDFKRGGRWNPGYRATDMMLIAAVWVFVGLSVWLRGDPDPNHKVPIEYLGETVRALFWLVPAAYAFVVALFFGSRDGSGFVALVIPASMRAASYVAAVVEGILTHNRVGGTGLWLEATVWVCITLFIYRQANRPDLPPIEPRKEKRRRETP